ncbi:hypothetical protein LOTGIDRAFT_171084 [Lottia gigantea]|uniref:Uncharacterized protein n=1 Tax=Lottia gigantea TaxID=225164 RepID=V4BEA8_LOTGI|nr:hypothetical protein LOTGIDRAFT_171084 [Lottia gigantea]ESP04112.1 hypothetical protein LOTGIDRAFT_171084 [Lottia gigantea]
MKLFGLLVLVTTFRQSYSNVYADYGYSNPDSFEYLGDYGYEYGYPGIQYEGGTHGISSIPDSSFENTAGETIEVPKQFTNPETSHEIASHSGLEISSLPTTNQDSSAYVPHYPGTSQTHHVPQQHHVPQHINTGMTNPTTNNVHVNQNNQQYYHGQVNVPSQVPANPLPSTNTQNVNASSYYVDQYGYYRPVPASPSSPSSQHAQGIIFGVGSGEQTSSLEVQSPTTNPAKSSEVPVSDWVNYIKYNPSSIPFDGKYPAQRQSSSEIANTQQSVEPLVNSQSEESSSHEIPTQEPAVPTIQPSTTTTVAPNEAGSNENANQGGGGEEEEEEEEEGEESEYFFYRCDSTDLYGTVYFR